MTDLSRAAPGEFKPGDRVRCVKNTPRSEPLPFGEEYVVADVRRPNLKLVGRGDRIYGFNQFELVTPRKSDPDFRALAGRLAAALAAVNNARGHAFNEVSGGLHIPKGSVVKFDKAFEEAEAALAAAKEAGAIE